MQAQQPALVPRLQQLVDQGGRSDEADRETPLAGGQPEPEGDVGLAGAARPERVIPCRFSTLRYGPACIPLSL